MKVNEFPDTLWLKHKNVDIGHRLRMAAPVGKLGKLFRLQKCIIVLLFVSFLCGMILGITLVTDSDFPFGSYKSDRPKEQIKQSNLIQDKLEKDIRQKQSIILENTKLQPGRVVNEKSRDNNDVHPLPGPQNPRLNLTTFDLWKKNRLKIRGNAESTKDEDVDITQGEKFPKPNYNVHAFYYPWYGNPETDGQYLHWNHQYLQHWDQNEAKKWPHGQHKPPDDIGAQFYPELGPYSSRKVEVMEEHMKQIRSAGVGVIAVSWYPPEQADEQGKPWDSFMPTLLDVANRFAVKVCFHIEPYQGRSANTMLRNFKYIHEKYGQHPAYYCYKHRNRKLPVFYVYDSYLVKKEEWGSILRPDGRKTIRNTPYDAVFVGLVVNERHKTEIIAAGFDGYYTYFASDGFTFGSGTRNWASLAQYARANEILFVPSVGPGYNDVRVRPWNAANTKDREYGGYYEQSFKAALAVRPPIISITSFNEWHEGTQIEKAAPKQYKNFKYSDYAPQPPDYYLVLTRKWALKLRRQQQQDIKHRSHILE